MNCEEALDMIQRNLDGDLSDWETVLLEKHLSVCSKCAKEKHDLEELSSRLSRLPQSLPPVSIVNQVLMQIDHNREKPSHRGSLWWIIGSTSAAVIIGGLLFWHLEGSSPNEQMLTTETESISSEQIMNNQQNQETVFEPSVPLWSPDGQYRAQVEERRVVIYSREGEVYFRSSQWAEEGETELFWTGEQKLTLQLKWEEKRIEVWQIDLNKEPPEVMIKDGP